MMVTVKAKDGFPLSAGVQAWARGVFDKVSPPPPRNEVKVLTHFFHRHRFRVLSGKYPFGANLSSGTVFAPLVSRAGSSLRAVSVIANPKGETILTAGKDRRVC
jgi:hypothetical protein